MPPRSTKGRPKATTSAKTKTSKKRALPEDDENPTQPTKYLRSSSVSGVDVEVDVPVAAPMTKPIMEAAKAMVTKGAPPTSLPDGPIDAVSTPTATIETFTGAFELYSMDIEILNAAYAPPYDDSGSFDESFYPEALYKAITTYRHKTTINEEGEEEGGPTAKLTIPIPDTKPSSVGLDDDEDEDNEDDTFGGTLTLATFHHPYCGGPVEIALVEISEQSQESLNSEIDTPDLGRPTDDAWDGPGISASLEIQDYEVVSMIPEASGKWYMRPLWKGIDADGKVTELFEGSFTFQCAFDRRWWKRGGEGINEDIVFWAVRGQA